MRRHRSSRIGFAWLELLLVLAFLTLFFQVFPALWWGLWAGLDARTWSRTTWFVLNVVVVLALFAVRFGPDLYADWRKRVANQRQQRHTAAQANESHADLDYQTRVRRDADWRERAKKRLPWHP